MNNRNKGNDTYTIITKETIYIYSQQWKQYIDNRSTGDNTYTSTKKEMHLSNHYKGNNTYLHTTKAIIHIHIILVHSYALFLL